MKKLLFLFIISMCQLAMSAQETYTATYAKDTHTLYLESSVMGDFQVWFRDDSGHEGEHFAYNGSNPGDHMTYVGETTSGTFVYKYKITKVSDVPTTFNLVRNGSEVRSNVAVSGISQTADPTFAMKSNKGRNVIYEMNIGMMTTEGTFAAAKDKLAGLKNLGVNIVWVMPIYPRHAVGGTEIKNSPYAATNFEDVNSSYGTKADFKAFVDEAHSLGMEVWLDWVPNHTATDHGWVTSHREYYTKDGSGNMIHPNSNGLIYEDVYELDYSNPDLCAEMTRIMKQWVTETGIDGFRNDYISSLTIPASYWTQCISELKQLKPGFKMMAEGDLTDANNLRLQNCGWDYDYAWGLQSAMREATKNGGSDAAALKAAFKEYNQNTRNLPFGRMTYVTNHDLNGNEDGGKLFTLYGNNRYAMTVMSFTVNGMPLIYNGQEIGDNDVLNYFEDATKVNWNNVDATMQTLVEKLAELKHTQLPLANRPAYQTATATLNTGRSDVLAYVRTIDNEAVLVVLNLSGSQQTFSISDVNPGTYSQIIKGSASSIDVNATDVTLATDGNITLDANGYAVYVLKEAANQYKEKATTVVYVRDVAADPIEPVTLYAFFDEGGTNVEPFGNWATARDYPTYTRWQDPAGNVWMRYVISEAPVGTNNINVIALAGGIQTDNLAVNGGSENNFVTIDSSAGNDATKTEQKQTNNIEGLEAGKNYYYTYNINSFDENGRQTYTLTSTVARNDSKVGIYVTADKAPYIHYWGSGSGSTTWRGILMEDKDGDYWYKILDGKPDGIIFNTDVEVPGDGYWNTASTGTLTDSEIASLTQMKREVRIFVQDYNDEIPHLYAWYAGELGETIWPQGNWGTAATKNNYSKYTSTFSKGNITNPWYCYTIVVPDGQSFNVIPTTSNGNVQVTDPGSFYIGPTVTDYYILKKASYVDGDKTVVPGEGGALSAAEAALFIPDFSEKDIDLYIRDVSGAIVHLYAKYTNTDGSFEYEPLGDKQSAFKTNLEVCLSNNTAEDGQNIWYHRKFRNVNSDYKVEIIAYANYRQAPDITPGDDNNPDVDNYYVLSASGNADSKTIYLVIDTKPTDGNITVTEKTYSSITLTPQKTKDYTIYVRKDNPTEAEQEAGDYLLNLYSWYNIDANEGAFQPAAGWPGTQLKERYIDETGQIWYCLHLKGIPFEIYEREGVQYANSTLYASINQNGDEDKSQDFNISELTGLEGNTAYLVYHGKGEALTADVAPGRLDEYPESEGGGTYYFVSPELTGDRKLPQFRFTPSRNRSMNGQDGQVNPLIHTFNIKDDEIAKRLSCVNSAGTTIHYRIVRGDDNPNFTFQPRTSGRNNYELGSGSAKETVYNTTGGTGYVRETYPYRLGQNTAFNFQLTQGTAQSYTFFIESTSTAASSVQICMNKSITEDNNGYYLIGNIDNSIEGASWSPANSNARMLMIRNEYKNPNDVAVTDSIVYTVTVPRSSNGWGALYLAVSPASRLTDNAWTVDDWGYVLRPQVQYQKDAIATEGGLFAHGEGQDSGDQSFNPSRFSDDYQSFTFSINLTTSTYRFQLNRGLYIMGDAINDKIDTSKDAWDMDNAHMMRYNNEGRYWFIENLSLQNGGKLRFANDKMMTSCFVENDYRPTTHMAGPENGREETQHVNIVKWRNEGRKEHKDLTNSQKADDVNFELAAGTYNIRFYIRSRVDNIGSGQSGSVSNDEYYCFYVIDPVEDFVGIPPTVTVMNPLLNSENKPYTFFRAYSSYHAMNRPEGVDVFYITTLNEEEKTVMLTPVPGDVIPRNTGVILASTADKSDSQSRMVLNFQTNDDPWTKPETLSGNLLKPVIESTHLEPKEGNKFNYIFGAKRVDPNDTGLTLGYYRPGNGKTSPGSSYLQIDKDLFWGTTEAPMFRMVMWNDTSIDASTDISELPAATATTASDDYYTTSGVKLQGRPTDRGIYIYKGKKIVIR